MHDVLDADAAGREGVGEPDPRDVVRLVCSVRRPIDGPSLDEFVDQPDRRARFERELRGRQASRRTSQVDASLRARLGPGDLGSSALSAAQLTAFFTSPTIRFSAAGVSSITANEVGNSSPSSIFASGWKPNVE